MFKETANNLTTHTDRHQELYLSLFLPGDQIQLYFVVIATRGATSELVHFKNRSAGTNNS